METAGAPRNTDLSCAMQAYSTKEISQSHDKFRQVVLQPFWDVTVVNGLNVTWFCAQLWNTPTIVCSCVHTHKHAHKAITGDCIEVVDGSSAGPWSFLIWKEKMHGALELFSRAIVVCLEGVS